MELIGAEEAPQWADRVHLDPTQPALLGSECGSCGRCAWPSRAICESCGSLVKLGVRFAPIGTLLAYTTVHIARAGIPAPYTLGLIELDSGVRLHAQVRGVEDGRPAPRPVALKVPATSDDGPSFWFEATGGPEGAA